MKYSSHHLDYIPCHESSSDFHHQTPGCLTPGDVYHQTPVWLPNSWWFLGVMSTMWGPPVISWFRFAPVTIVISTINQLRYLGGLTLYHLQALLAAPCSSASVPSSPPSHTPWSRPLWSPRRRSCCCTRRLLGHPRGSWGWGFYWGGWDIHLDL